MSDWTLQRIEQLAPDAAAIKAAQGVAQPSKWHNLGRTERLLWGECQGSGSNPYQVRIDLADVAYKCGCPSRKLPCKHTLGLLMLMAKGTNIAASTPPGFVEEWAANRAKRAEVKATRTGPETPEDREVPAKRAENRTEKRESRVEAGLAQLESWLADLLAQGLAAARAQPPSFWSQMSARLIDAQAPGLAQRVRGLESIALTATDWQELLLAQLARLQLIIDAYRRMDSLPASLAAEVRATIGWTQSQESLRERAGLRDQWQVVGCCVSEVDQLRVRSTWLIGQSSRRPALLLDFAAGNQALAASFVTGQVLDATLVWFDGDPPLRAILQERHGAGDAALNLAAFAATPAEAQTQFAAQLVRCPWLDRWPVTVGPVRPIFVDGCWMLSDESGRGLRLSGSFRHGWSLRALAAKAPLHVFGQLDGHAFEPISVACDNEWFSLATLGPLAVLAKVA